jgi:DivIVA domain-containing protein
MTSAENGSGNGDRGLTPADLRSVQFTRASMLRPGYLDTEVDRVMHRVAEEIGRHIAEKAELRDQVRALQAQCAEAPVQAPPPSEQAVRILASAQQTADNYVAEAEEFSRQVTSEARAEYEDAVRRARENAGAIIQAAQEAAANLGGGAPAGANTGRRGVEELQEQVVYLKAFGQAVRVQLRSYLEALLTDVETEWGRADPAALPQEPPRPPAQRSGRDGGTGPGTTFTDNTVAEPSPSDAEEDHPAAAGSRSPS